MTHDDRQVVLSIRLTRCEKDLVERATGHTSETLSSFARRLLIPQARGICARAEREQRENATAATAA